MGKLLRVILVTVTLGISAWYFAAFGSKAYPFYGDAMGYYMYLPCVFIYHNLKAVDWLPADKHFDREVTWHLAEHRREGRWSPRGYLMIKYTYGVAALEAPFFFAAHAWEKITGGSADGYSASYALMVKIGTMFYALLGLYILYVSLKRLFSPGTALFTTCITFAGTNLFWFSLHQAGMSHVPLFFLYSLLLYLTILIHEKRKTYLFVLAGLTAGLITIIRPTDILCLLIPLLYGVWGWRTAKDKLAFLRSNVRGVVLFAIAFIPPLLPQMIYWKKFAGSYLYYSYGSETFNWTEPKIIAGLFHFNNGWLVYTPLMALALFGLLLYKRIRPVSILSYLLLPAYVYVVYSWYCYNYINGLGSRPMIHMYPLLAIPLGAVVSWAWEKHLLAKSFLAASVLFCISINITYSVQQARNILFSEESNATYNLHMLYKLRANYADLVVNDVQQVQPDEGELKKVATLSCASNEDSLSDHFIRDTTGRSRFVYAMAAEEEYYPGILKVAYDPATFKDAKWIKCSGRFYCVQHFSYYRHLMTLQVKNDRGEPWWWGCRIDNKIGLTEPGVDPAAFTFDHCELNKWGYVYFYIRLPEKIMRGDELWLDVWNIGKMPILIDDLCLELYK